MPVAGAATDAVEPDRAHRYVGHLGRRKYRLGADGKEGGRAVLADHRRAEAELDVADPVIAAGNE